MKSTIELIVFDAFLIIEVLLLVFRVLTGHDAVVLGIAALIMLFYCVRDHVATYKMSGKIY